MWLRGRRRLSLRQAVMMLMILGGMGYVAMCTDRYALTMVLIEAPASARLSIDGQPLQWCKHELNGAVGCSKEPHDGVRIYQWQLRSEMQVPLQLNHQGLQETFELTTPDEPVTLGYQIVMASGKPALYEVDPMQLQ